MKVLLVVFGSLLAFVASQDVKVEYPMNEFPFPAGKLEENKALKNFVKVVEENKMNVTVIVSSAKNYGKGNLKEAMTISFTFPTTNEVLKKSELNQEQGKKFLKTATDENLAARIEHYNRAGDHKVWTNNAYGVPHTVAHKFYSTYLDEEAENIYGIHNTAAQYTFIVHGADGKNQTTKVLTADLKIDVVDSKNINEEEIETIKKVLAGALMMYEEEDVPLVLTKGLKHVIKPQQDWSAVAEIGDHSYVNANKWVLLKIVDDKYLVYVD